MTVRKPTRLPTVSQLRREIAVQTPTRDTATVIERFNQAFVAHDGSLLVDLVSDACVMESVDPAPDGTRIEGREACLAFWQRLAEDRNGLFAPEDVASLAIERSSGGATGSCLTPESSPSAG
jgi:hypothetical protein